MTESNPLLFQRLLLWLSKKAKENRVPLCAALIFVINLGKQFTNTFYLGEEE